MKRGFCLKNLVTVALLALITFSIASITVHAAPAAPEPFLFKQPDGKEIAVRLRGDEFLNWTEDMSGNIVVFDETKSAYCYADWTDEIPVSTGILIEDAAMPNSAEQGQKPHKIPQMAIDAARKRREDLRPSAQAAAASDSNVFGVYSSQSSDIPAVADISMLRRKILVIYARWTDEENFDKAPLSGQQIYDLVFNPQTNSVNAYYKELLGQTEDVVIPANVNNPLNGKQGIIEVFLPGSHINPGNNFSKAANIVTAAYNAADPSVDFSEYDINGDGEITSDELTVCIIAHGYEASYSGASPSVWGSAGYTGGIRDGVYTPSSFIQGAYHEEHPLTVGILCHEFGHSGYYFNDTYDYGGLDGQSRGMGFWSLMAYGSWGAKSGEFIGATPSYADAYNLVSYNLVSPGVLSGRVDNIKSVSQTDIYKVISPYSDTQYFLTQPRMYGSADNFDRGAFDRISWMGADESMGGLLICHVDEAVWSMNDKNTHYRAGIEEAHGGTQHLSIVWGSDGGIDDLWGTDYVLFSHTTDPSSGLYSPFTYDTVPPSQDQESGVTLYGINWDIPTQSVIFGVREGLTYAEAFPDPGFRAIVLDMIGGGRNDESVLTIGDRAFFTNFINLDVAGKFIADLTGIEFFTGLRELNCQGNRLFKLGLSKNKELTVLDCSNNRLRSLDILENNLSKLDCSENFITSPNSVPGCEKIVNLKFYPQNSYDSITYAEAFPDKVFRQIALDFIEGERNDTDIISPDDFAAWAAYNGELYVSYRALSDLAGIEFFTDIYGLSCAGNSLKMLDMSQNTLLEFVYCWDNQIKLLELSKNTELRTLSCSGNMLSLLDISKLKELEVLNCAYNQLSVLDVRLNNKLRELDCQGNYLADLDLSCNSGLQWLYCDNNRLTKLDISYNTLLRGLRCGGNQLPDLDVSQCIMLEFLYCYDNDLEVLDVAKNKSLAVLSIEHNRIYELDVSYTKLTWLSCFYNFFTTPEDITGWQQLGLILDENFLFYPQKIDITGSFTDLNFRTCVYEIIGKIAPEPIYSTDVMDVPWLSLGYRRIQSLAGLEWFFSLEYLNCYGNQLKELPGLPESLSSLNCSDNQLTELPDLPINLEYLGCYGNQLKELPGLPESLSSLNCGDNQLTELPDLPVCLEYLYCYSNHLTELPDLPENIKSLDCGDNRLTKLPALPTSLEYLYCQNNWITELDVSSNINLRYLYCTYNSMETIDDVIGWELNPWLILDNTFCFYLQRPKPLPVPTRLTYDGDGIISWDAVPGAKWYFIHIGYPENNWLVSLDENVTTFNLRKVLESINEQEFRNNELQVSVSAVGGYSPWEPTHASEPSTSINVPIPVLPGVLTITIDSDGHTLRWNSIPGVEFYLIYVDGFNHWMPQLSYADSTISTSLRHFRLSPGAYEIRIRGISINDGFGISEPSNTVFFTQPSLIPLKMPTGVAINSSILTWNTVEGADGYEIIIFANGYGYAWGYEVNKSEFDMRFIDYLTVSEVYDIYVRALGDWTYYSHSVLSDPVPYTPDGSQPRKLDCPVNLRLNNTILMWESVENACGYSVLIDEWIYDLAEDTSLDLGTLGLPVGTYAINVIAYGEWGDFRDSEPSDTLIYYVTPLLSVDWSGITLRSSITYGNNKASSFTSLPTNATAMCDDEPLSGIFTIADPDAILQAGNGIISVDFTVTTDGVYYGVIITKDFLITVVPKPLSDSMINVAGTYSFIGSAIIPEYTVSDGLLISTSDYNVDFMNNLYAGNAIIVVTATDTGNYSGIATQDFTISKAVTSVGQILKSHPTETASSGTIYISSYLPEDRGVTSYTYGDANSGGLIDSSNLSEAGLLTYTTIVSPEEETFTFVISVTMQNYETTNVLITISSVREDEPILNKEPILAEGPTVAGIIKFGQPLSMLSINAKFKDEHGSDVQGTIMWDDPSCKPYAGSTDVIWKFIPEDVFYLEVTGTIIINVDKAIPKGSPTSTPISSVGKTLADTALTGTFTNPYNDTIVTGLIVWNLGDSQTVAANTAYNWTFTPDDTVNYEVVKGNLIPYKTDNNSGSTTIQAQEITGQETPLAEGISVEIPGIDSLKTPDGQAPVINPDGSVTLPGGGTIITSGGSEIDVPEGTVISSDGTVTIPNGIKGGTITNKDGSVIQVGPGMSIIISEKNIPFSSLDTVWLNPFIDVNKTDWFYENILFTFTRGLTNGTSANTFSPQGALTRGMLVTILYRNTGEPEISGLENPFSDVGDAYYTNPIIWAVENGIVNGYGNSNFGPNDYITRQDLAVILMRYASLIGYEVQSVREYSSFKDELIIADYAKESVIALCKASIINGKESNFFDPLGNATRAEVAAMLHRFLDKH